MNPIVWGLNMDQDSPSFKHNTSGVIQVPTTSTAGVQSRVQTLQNLAYPDYVASQNSQFQLPTGLPRLLIEGSLEVKLPTIWRDEKQSRAEAERRERLEERRVEEKESEERRYRCAKR